MKEFNLKKEIDNWTFDSDILAEMFNVKAISAEDSIIVNTGFNNVRLGNGLFRAEFYYRKDKLTHIKLMPKIEGTVDPGYPNKQYEEVKFKYCKEILKQLYGDKPVQISIGVQYETPNYVIGCYVKRKGKNKYGGGNIVIVMKQKEQN